MAEPKFIPETFQAQANSIATYSYTDIADGTGKQIFYGFQTKTSAGTKYNLSTIALYSSTIELALAAIPGSGSGAYSDVFDLDFDLPEFNLPKTIKGTALVVVPIYMNEGGAVAFMKVQALVRKWDGTTETEIANATSAEYSATGVYIATFPVTIPETHFKAGEPLRVTLKLQGKEFSGDVTGVTMALDPMDRDGTYIIPSTAEVTTQVIFHIPFKLTELGY